MARIGTRWLRRHLLGLVLASVALVPTAVTVIDASAGPRELTEREKILKKLPKDPTVLINVTVGDMPSSGDILNLGKRSTRALERCLSDNADGGMRSTCAEMLGYLGDRSALPTLQTALQDWDSGVRLSVVNVLGRIPDESSFAPLMELFKRRDEPRYMRSAILDTLGKLGSPKAVQVLRRELRNEPSEKEKERLGDHRYSAFWGLWASRHLVARGTLVQDVTYALRSDEESLVYAATEAAAELRDPSLVTPLTQLVDHRDAEIRNKAVRALGLIGNPAATRVLVREMRRVRDARMLNNIAFALERLDKKEYQLKITQLASHKQAVVRLNAAFVLGDVKQPDGLPLLTKALDDPNDLVKASAISAIGKLGAKEGMEPLMRFVNHPNAYLRQEAIYAINDLSGGQQLDLIHEHLYDSTYAKSDEGESMRWRAAGVLGEAGDKRVGEYLLQCYEQDRCNLSFAGGYFALDDSPQVTRRLFRQWALGARELTNEVARRRPSGMRELALGEKDAALGRGSVARLRRVVDLLGEIGQPADRREIANFLRSKDTRLRLHTTVALLRLGHEKADQKLFVELDNLPVDWLPMFARIVSGIKEPTPRKKLVPELEKRTRGDDVDIALACAAILLSWDPESGFFRFLDGLSAKTTHERDLAEAYLRRARSKKLKWVMRRALARETRPYTRDRLRQLLD